LSGSSWLQLPLHCGDIAARAAWRWLADRIGRLAPPNRALPAHTLNHHLSLRKKATCIRAHGFPFGESRKRDLQSALAEGAQAHAGARHRVHARLFTAACGPDRPAMAAWGAGVARSYNRRRATRGWFGELPEHGVRWTEHRSVDFINWVPGYYGQTPNSTPASGIKSPGRNTSQSIKTVSHYG
jgi:hypothetical protein